MPTDSRVLSCRVTDQEARAFGELARTLGQGTASALLAACVRELLDSRGEPQPAAAPSPPPSESGRALQTRVSADEAQAAVALAGYYGGVAVWLRGIVLAQVRAVDALPAESEIRALNEATTQLWHAANNLNQVARALNEARRAGMPLPVEKVRPELLEQMRERIEALAAANASLIARARQRGVCRG